MCFSSWLIFCGTVDYARAAGTCDTSACLRDDDCVDDVQGACVSSTVPLVLIAALTRVSGIRVFYSACLSHDSSHA